MIIQYFRSCPPKLIGGACSMNGGEEECIYDIGGKARRKEITGKTKM
jgi:hypothetical protein